LQTKPAAQTAGFVIKKYIENWIVAKAAQFAGTGAKGRFF
jgi:hypothetical protein